MKTLVLIILAVSFAMPLFSQKKGGKLNVTGTVTNFENHPIRGVTIYVDSVKTKGKTNKKGSFKLKLDKTPSTLSFYSPTHGIGNVPYRGKAVIDFSFSKDSKFLSIDDLADMGYREPFKKVYGSGEINFENDPSVLNYTDIFQLIGVRFAGVTVVDDTISIRGSANASMTENVNREPLYLVNGSPVSSIAAIAPDQVKSIKIMKSSESGRYGMRGANGVVSITLKN
ncbi:TonB-dependent receptor plug domain-containing protein [Allomuricauda sp. d1]|uniref:TonB-dependent receptor plug domain-containing protein n=1 Tax=Allomuricauda sp. d1 TaxID=3136725 RepID=UPI0031CDE462